MHDSIPRLRRGLGHIGVLGGAYTLAGFACMGFQHAMVVGGELRWAIRRRAAYAGR